MPTIQVCSKYYCMTVPLRTASSQYLTQHSFPTVRGKVGKRLSSLRNRRSIIVINGRYRAYVMVSLFCKPLRENSPPSPYLTDYFRKGLLFNFPQNKIIVLNCEKKIQGLAFISVINSRKQNESITNTYNSVQNLSKRENLHFSIEVITLLSHTVKSK